MTHPLTARMAAGDAVLGMIVRLGRSGDIARIARGSSHDFLFIDTQHSLFNLETIGHIAQAAMGVGIPALVRVGGVDDPNVAVLLAGGVSGIVFPDVADAAAARRAVAKVRFPPAGERSVSGAYPHLDYRPTPYAKMVETLDASSLIVCMVETRRGVANIEEIAAVEGVDVVHVGTHDLLADLGKPGQYDAPEVLDAYARTVSATRANGIFAGMGGNRDIDRQVAAVRMGVRFLTTQADIGFLVSAATAWTASIREKLSSPPG